MKPYFVTNVLEVESVRQYNTWNELMAKDADFLDELSVVIPAPDGLFMAQLSKTEHTVEIRTFIDYAHTSDDRKMVRDLMIRVSDPLLESPLSAFPAVAVAQVDSGAMLLVLAVCKQLAPHADALARCLFPRKEQEPAQPNAYGLFQEQLSRFAADADWFWEAFESMPLRQFLTQGTHLLRQLDAMKTGSGAP